MEMVSKPCYVSFSCIRLWFECKSKIRLTKNSVQESKKWTWSDLWCVFPVHGVDGGSRWHSGIHVHELRVGWIPRRSIFHATTGMVGHVRRARMVRARWIAPASNFGGSVRDKIWVKEPVGLLLLRRRRRFRTTTEGVRVFHFVAGTQLADNERVQGEVVGS